MNFSTCATRFFLTIAFSVVAFTTTEGVAQLPEKIAEVEGITEYRLDNGVKILLFPDNSKPQFTLNMTVLVGSRHEGYGETGMAHLLEHMLFRGTDLFPDIPKFLKDRGVLNMNGTTSFDRTNYFETLPAKDDNLEFAISMEADRLVNSWIKQEHLDAEMTVVRSEFERGENSPQSILFQRIMTSAYQWHNYGNSTIGNRSDIMRVPASSLRVFYRKYYQPDNITLVLAGKFDQVEALELFANHFGSIPKPKRELSATYTEEPAQDGERLTVLRRSGDVQLVGVGYHVPSAASVEYAPTEVLATLLGMEPSGPLYKNLVETELATSAGAFDLVGHDPGMLIALVEVPVDADLSKAQKALLETIESIGTDGLQQADVDRAIRKIIKGRERQFANTESFATNLSEWESYGDWRLYFLHRDRLEKVTTDAVQQVAKKYLIESNRTVGQFLPTADAVRAEVPSRPNLKKLVAGYQGREKIAAGEAFDPTPENIENRTVSGALPSGLKYSLLAKETRGDRVVLTGELRYGNEESLKGRVTAAEFLPELLSRGTKQLSFQEFSDQLDQLKATLNFGGSTGKISFSLQTERKFLIPALGLLKQALREPRLDENEFNVVCRQKRTEIESSMSEPTVLAMVELNRKLDPQSADDVRYTPTMSENLYRIESLTLEDVQSLHKDFIGGQNGEIAIVGDFDPDTTLQKLEEVFSDWDSSQGYARIAEPYNDQAEPGRFTIDTPDKANAIYVAALSAPIRDDHADYEALLIGNYIMGGGPLSSRIADRVRKQEGLSYTAMSRFQADSEDEQAIYMMLCISNPANTEKVVSTVAEIVEEMLADGVTEEELDKAKESYLNNRRGMRAKESRLASMLKSNLKTGRSMEFYAASDKKIESLTKSQVDSALRRLIQPEKLIIITAGDFSKAEESK